MNLLPRSVRLRLTLWYAAALAAILIVFSAGVFIVLRASLLHGVALRAQQELAVVTGMLEENPSDIAELEEHGMATLFAVAHGDNVVFATESWKRLGLPAPGALTTASGAGANGDWRWESPAEDHVRGASATVDAGNRTLVVAAAADEIGARRSLAALAAILALGFPVALAIAVAGGWFLAGRMLRPVSEMADAARCITAERLADRLPVERDDDEFGRLATVFNQTLARLEDAFARLRRFTSDASHELRTPLTAIRSVGEVALREDAPAAHYRDAIGSMLEEVDRLTRLVDSLLSLTRADSGAHRAAAEPVDLAALAHDAVESLRVLAEEKEQTIAVTAEREVIVAADRVTLRQAIMNLLDNAIKYSPPGARIAVAVRLDGVVAVLDVTDSGPGIAPEHRDRIFERFYRIDLGRSRATGGVGLGLAIARWAVELNGGTIEVESTAGSGSTFRIALHAQRPTGVASTRRDTSLPGTSPAVEPSNPLPTTGDHP